MTLANNRKLLWQWFVHESAEIKKPTPAMIHSLLAFSYSLSEMKKLSSFLQRSFTMPKDLHFQIIGDSHHGYQLEMVFPDTMAESDFKIVKMFDSLVWKGREEVAS